MRRKNVPKCEDQTVWYQEATPEALARLIADLRRHPEQAHLADSIERYARKNGPLNGWEPDPRRIYGEAFEGLSERERAQIVRLGPTLRGTPTVEGCMASDGRLNPHFGEVNALWCELRSIALGESSGDRVIKWIRALEAEGRANSGKPADPVYFGFLAFLNSRPAEERKSKRLQCSVAQLVRWLRKYRPETLGKTSKSTVHALLERTGFKTVGEPSKASPSK